MNIYIDVWLKGRNNLIFYKHAQWYVLNSLIQHKTSMFLTIKFQGFGNGLHNSGFKCQHVNIGCVENHIRCVRYGLKEKSSRIC